jgi:protein O-mannosyl-transferase
MASGNKNTVQKQTRAGKNLSPSQFTIPAIIFLLCLLLYGNTLFNGYAMDDKFVTFKNEFIIKGFSAFKDIFDKGSMYGYESFRNSGMYRPLMLLSFMTEVSIFGLNPHVSHFFNVLLFAFTAVALYFFLQKILKNYNQAVIIAATLLFAFHPIHTEAVANIKSRDEILGLLFGLLSFYYIMLYREKNKNSYYFYSIAAFFASLFCKENCLTFIAIIPLLLYFFTGLETKKIALTSIPYIIATGLYMFIRSLVLQHITFAHQISVSDNTLMATDSIMDRTATSFVLLGKYIYMTIIPYPLSWDYSYNQIPVYSWGHIEPILSLSVCAALVVFMLWGIKKKSIYSFLIAFFFITLLLSSNLIIKIAATFGERFLYAPSLSFCIALPVLAAKWKNKTYFYVPIACILIIYTIIVIPRNAEWKNNYTLFSSGVIASPNSGRAHKSLAFIYLDSAKASKDTVKRLQFYALAVHEFKKSIEIFPTDLKPDSYNDLGACYFSEGYQDSAILAYKKALEINLKFSNASDNLGVIYFNKAQYDSALSYFLMSYKTNPNNLDVLKKIGTSYQNKKNYALALHYDSLILKKAPKDKPTQLQVSFIHNAMGMQLSRPDSHRDESDKALEEFTIALNYNPNNANALGNIGAIYAKKGNIEMAKKYFKKALVKDPKNEAFAKDLQSMNGKRQ